MIRRVNLTKRRPIIADTKISALTALTGADVAPTSDVLAIVDTSVTTTKKILVSELFTSPTLTTSLVTGSTTFTAFAGATTLLTIGGTGASSVFAIPGTLEWSGTTGALTVAGGVYVAKKLNVVGALTAASLSTAGVINATGSTSTHTIAGNIRVSGAQQENTASSSYLTNEGNTLALVSTGTGSGAGNRGLVSFNIRDGGGANSLNWLTVAATGAVTITNLAGSGTRTVVVDANGVMSAP